ncbi:MAG: L,D-transpeptidase [Bradyrhizobium sp.]
MRSFLVAFVGITLLSCTAAQAAVAVTVNKDTQTLTVAVDGVPRYQWPVSTGVPAYETPDGSFHAFRMDADHVSRQYNDAPMPDSIFFTKTGIAIHGTDEQRRLGTPASHGCVRLSPAHAATLFALVKQQGLLSTTVTVTGSSRTWLARNRGRSITIAKETQPGRSQYAAGQPMQLTSQPQYYSGYQRPDDGYIYPADGSSNAQVYPAPSRPLYHARAYPQRYYNNPGYAAPRYYRPRYEYYQPRGLFQD